MDSKYPKHFKKFLLKLVEITLKVQPKNIIEFLAIYLEAELNKRSLYEICDKNDDKLNQFKHFMIDWSDTSECINRSTFNNSSLTPLVRYTINLAYNIKEVKETTIDVSSNQSNLNMEKIFLQRTERDILSDIISGEIIDCSFQFDEVFGPKHSTQIEDSYDSSDFSKTTSRKNCEDIFKEFNSDIDSEGFYFTPRGEYENCKTTNTHYNEINTINDFIISNKSDLNNLNAEDHCENNQKSNNNTIKENNLTKNLFSSEKNNIFLEAYDFDKNEINVEEENLRTMNQCIYECEDKYINNYNNKSFIKICRDELSNDKYEIIQANDLDSNCNDDSSSNNSDDDNDADDSHDGDEEINYFKNNKKVYSKFNISSNDNLKKNTYKKIEKKSEMNECCKYKNTSYRVFHTWFHQKLSNILIEHRDHMNFNAERKIPILCSNIERFVKFDSIKPKIILDVNKKSPLIGHIIDNLKVDKFANGDTIEVSFNSSCDYNEIYFSDAHDVYFKIIKSNKSIKTQLFKPGQISDVIFPGYPIITTDIIINPEFCPKEEEINQAIVAGSIVKKVISDSLFLFIQNV